MSEALKSNIPKNWKKTKLGNLGTFQNGLNKSKQDFGFGTKFVNILDVYSDRLNLDKLGRMNANKSELVAYRLEIGDILIDRSSVKLEGVGYPTIFEGSDETVVFCGFIIRLRISSSDVNPFFLCKLMRNDLFRNKIFQIATRSANVNVNQEQLAKLDVLIPPLPEQQKIAEILDTVENAIALTQTHINKLKLAKAGLLHDLLTKGIDEHGELRNPKRNPEQFKDSPLGKIPKDWKVEKLEYICERITDGSHQSVTTSDTGIPFLYVSCVRDGQILWEQAAKISDLLYTQISKGREPKTGLILYTAVGSYGHAALVQDDMKFSFQRHIAYVLPNQEKVIPGYLCLWLNSPKCKNYADKVALGNAQKTVTLGALAAFPVAFPLNLEQQNNIVESFDGYNKQIMNRQTRLEKLKLLKLGLMSDLLTGKVRVKI